MRGPQPMYRPLGPHGNLGQDGWPPGIGQTVRPLGPGTTGRPQGPGPTIQPQTPGLAIRPPRPGPGTQSQGHRPAIWLSGPSQAKQPPGLSPAIRPPGPSSDIRQPGPSQAIQPPGPGPAMRPPGPVPAIRPPGPSSAIRPPGPSQAIRPPGSGPALRPPGPGPAIRPPGSSPAMRPPGPSLAIRTPGPSPAMRPPGPGPAGQHPESMSGLLQLAHLLSAGLLGMPPRPGQPGTILGTQGPVLPLQREPAPRLGAVPVMKYTCNDPAGAHCRVFVGNLNTVSLKTRDVETIFGQYGLMCGIVLHKGYAFVQFTNPVDARKACNEDGKTYAGRRIVVNIASERKNQPGAKKRLASASVSAISQYTRNHSTTAQSDSPFKKLRTDLWSNANLNLGAGIPSWLSSLPISTSASTQATPQAITRKKVDLNAEMQRFENFLAELQNDENPSKQPVEVEGKKPELDMEKEGVTKLTADCPATTPPSNQIILPNCQALMPPPKKKMKYSTKCQVCEKPAQVHYKKHVLKYHLPWFMNPTVACSDCLKSEGDNSALNRYHLYHGHRGIVGEDYLQAWCLLMNGMFYFIMQELGLKSFSDLLAYAGTLEIRFIKFREEELVFLREYDRRAGMEPLKDFEYMTIPPTRIISLSYYMVMAEILLKMSETAQTAFQTLNHYVKTDGSVAPEGHVVFKLAIIDSHFHMDMLSSDILTLTAGLDNPSINPVQLMYGIASYVHVETWHTINRHLRSNPALRFTIGVDPHEVLPHMARPLFSMLESRLSQHPDALGIGEVGLDYTTSCLSDHDKEDCSVSDRQIEEQHQFLRHVFKLFKQDDNKVLVLHARDKGDGSAARDVLSLLEEYGLQDARIHRNCFVGGKKEYETWSKTLPNCYFSLARRSLEEIGTETWALLSENKDRLILETNAPYNEEKEPLNVYKIAEEVASKTGMTPNDLVRVCNMNAIKLYNLTWQRNPA